MFRILLSWIHLEDSFHCLLAVVSTAVLMSSLLIFFFSPLTRYSGGRGSHGGRGRGGRLKGKRREKNAATDQGLSQRSLTCRVVGQEGKSEKVGSGVMKPLCRRSRGRPVPCRSSPNWILGPDRTPNEAGTRWCGKGGAERSRRKRGLVDSILKSGGYGGRTVKEWKDCRYEATMGRNLDCRVC